MTDQQYNDFARQLMEQAPPLEPAVKPVSMSYVVYCPGGCKAIRFAIVDDGHKDVAKEVGKKIKQGYAVERVTSQTVRDTPFGCQCKKEGEQLGLFK